MSGLSIHEWIHQASSVTHVDTAVAVDSQFPAHTAVTTEIQTDRQTDRQIDR